MDKLRQIAEEAGVSPNTVLRVLRGENKEVWASARHRAAKIRKLAQDRSYLPNGSARAMRSGRFNCVDLLLSADRGRSHLPDGLFNNIHDALAVEGMRLIVSKLPDDKLTNSEVMPAILRELSCDGLLINYTDHIPEKMVRLIGRHQVPSIWINCRQQADCVYYDDFGGAATATEHLLRLGHRRIVYMDFVAHDGPILPHYSRADRYAGHVAAMRAAGLTPTPRERFRGIPVEERLEATRRLLTSEDRPTALISYDSGERLLYAAALAGLRVPQDVSLLSFGSEPTSSQPAVRGEMFIGRDLTAMRVPAGKAGREAVRMLLKKIADPKRDLSPCVVPLEFDPGQTTRQLADPC